MADTVMSLTEAGSFAQDATAPDASPMEAIALIREGVPSEVLTHIKQALDLTDARAWMHAPNMALGDEPPLQFADTEPGARRVDQLLGQIEHGVAL